MSHLVGTFRRACPANVQVIGLHRQGERARDAHGADLAVSVTKGDFRKIAFLQLKRAPNAKVRLEYSQLEAVMQSGLPPQAFFVLSANPQNFDFRLTAAESEWRRWPHHYYGPQGSRTTHTAYWTDLRRWVERWLSCEVGSVSGEEFSRAQDEVMTRMHQFEELGEATLRRPDGFRRWVPKVLIKIALPDNYQDYTWR